jgi:hypothetical protein
VLNSGGGDDAMADNLTGQFCHREEIQICCYTVFLEVREFGEIVWNEPDRQASDEYGASCVASHFHECQRGPFRHGVTGRLLKTKPNTQPEET